MSFTVKEVPTAIYRTVTAVDPTSLPSTVFTTDTSPIPVIAATGQPNAQFVARFTAAADTIGVTLCAINRDRSGVVTVLGFSSEFSLAKTNTTALDDGAPKYYSQPVSLASVYGAKSAQLMGAGPITHVALIVTTAPTSAHSTDLYFWTQG